MVWLRTSRNKELLSHARDIKIYLLLRCICIASQVSRLSLMATCVVTLVFGSFTYVPIKALKASVKARHRIAKRATAEEPTVLLVHTTLSSVELSTCAISFG
jgi:hypothetical protein